MSANPRSLEDNLGAASGYLARFAEAPTLHIIGGEATPSASEETFADNSPIDGAHLGDVAAGDAADIDAAAAVATAAFEEWSATSGRAPQGRPSRRG